MGIIPTLRLTDRTINDDQRKAYALIQAFPPQLPIIIDEPRQERHRPDAVPSGAIASHEVKAAALMKMDWGPNLGGVEHPTRTPNQNTLIRLCSVNSGLGRMLSS